MRVLKSYNINREDAAEIRNQMKSVKNKHACRRLEALALLGEGKTAKEVAGIKGSHEKYVRTLRSAYCRNGIEPFLSDGRKGGNHLLRKPEQAKVLLSEFYVKCTQRNGQYGFSKPLRNGHDGFRNPWFHTIEF